MKFELKELKEFLIYEVISTKTKQLLTNTDITWHVAMRQASCMSSKASRAVAAACLWKSSLIVLCTGTPLVDAPAAGAVGGGL